MLQLRLILLPVIAILTIANTNAKKVDITPRIVNGKNAERGQFPFYVFMDVTTRKFFIVISRNHFCKELKRKLQNYKS